MERDPRGQAVAGSTRPHSTYSRLVREDDDLVGHVAYALYKRDKIHFCEEIRAEHSRAVSQAEVETFIRSSNMPARISSYRDVAERMLERFSEIMLDVTIGEIESQKNREIADRLSEAKSWRRGVFENLIANILALALTALVAVVLYGMRIGFVPLLGEIFGYDVKERLSVSQTAPAPSDASKSARPE